MLIIWLRIRDRIWVEDPLITSDSFFISAGFSDGTLLLIDLRA